MTREQLLTGLQQEYAQKREDNMRLYEQHKDEACARCVGLEDLLVARHAAIVMGVRTSLLQKQKNPKASTNLPNAMQQYNQRIAALLEKNGLDSDYLQPIYTCQACKDEGYIYDPSRRMCECMATELNSRVLRDLGLDGDKHTFEAFDETLFSDEKTDGAPSQRAVTKINRDICIRYADSFPQTPTRDLLLIGKSGLGKTFLLQAIARRVVQRGYMPVYTSAYRMFELTRRAYMENNSAIMQELMNAELLLLDDLGTEPLMNNVTVTQLFNLLNERQLAGRHTVISTNLSFNEIAARYTERISSRFLDQTGCSRLVFIGDDIRKNLRRGANEE
ncbi:MAG: ATP-binding protein [Clostridiales bacterium]|nr:ATP-binding protein [Clostridiales bacterium]